MSQLCVRLRIRRFYLLVSLCIISSRRITPGAERLRERQLPAGVLQRGRDLELPGLFAPEERLPPSGEQSLSKQAVSRHVGGTTPLLACVMMPSSLHTPSTCGAGRKQIRRRRNFAAASRARYMYHAPKHHIRLYTPRCNSWACIRGTVPNEFFDCLCAGTLRVREGEHRVRARAAPGGGAGIAGERCALVLTRGERA